MDFSALARCTDLRDAHIVEAVASREAMTALLARFVKLAAPGQRAPILLAALARMGTTACDWIDGDLVIEITGGPAQTKIVVLSDLGGGFREKQLPDTILPVPFEEFSRGVARAPKLIEPLSVKEGTGRIVLSVSAEIRKTSLPPPMIQIDPSSLLEPSFAAPPMPRGLTAVDPGARRPPPGLPNLRPRRQEPDK